MVLQDLWTRTQRGALPCQPPYAGDAPDGGSLPPKIAAQGTFHLLRLQRAGLIKEKIGAFFDYAGGEYLATATLRSLMALVDELDGEETNLAP